ncbi:MAG: arylsulfatase [Verrucomicrobia bacterium]|nr:arylsulfatase [Verrucomicrobiota bacterium]
MPLHARNFLLLASVLFPAVEVAAAPPREAPNVIVLITDDQGYGDLSGHGNPLVRTPHLDRLHAESVRFTDFHAAPMCTPTRGQLMTGVDALRNGAMNVSSGRTLLRREFPTVAELLRTAGYATGLFGKWHLGDNHPFRPEDRGFDQALWFPSSHIGSVPDHWNNDYQDDMYRENGSRKRFQGYTTDVFFGEAMRWMQARKNAGRPFFCYLATAAPHGPHHVAPSYREAVRSRLEAVAGKLPRIEPGVRENLVRFLGMIEQIDENVGRLEDFLRREGLRENTVLIYLTDNGSTMGFRYFNAGMKGAKVSLWEGGHRVPLFVRWPAGKLGEPRDVTTLAQVQDLAPTLVELSGADAVARFDGRSLVPLLRGETVGWPDRKLVINYSRMPQSTNAAGPDSQSVPRKDGAAVLWRHWRWLENRSLYDLATDPLQERDVATEHPAVVAELRAHLDRWWDGVQARVNEPQAVIIGSDAENPVQLTACEWWDVFVDQQAQIRRGVPRNGVWHLEVARAGRYAFELRRWPREADAPLAGGLAAAKHDFGEFPAGTALPIAAAEIRAGAHSDRRKVEVGEHEVTFAVQLPAGRTTLQTWFRDAAGRDLCGAYYVYVTRQ